MIRLPPPSFTYENALDTCLEGITGNPELRRKLSKGKDELLTAGTNYANRANLGTLYEIAAAPENRDNEPFVDELTPNELITVYEQYLVGAQKPGRRLYDEIKSLAKDKCPFCGINSIGNVDHFLPKKHFPQFSVYPQNLVPACRDCNMGAKRQSYATSVDEQVIHPFSDHSRFFETQWISAVYHPEQGPHHPGWTEFSATPPDDWSSHDAAKVKKHFEDFGLAKMYGIQAAEQLIVVLLQIRSAGTSEMARQIILQPVIDSPLHPNHWKRVMYQALLQHLERLPA